MAQAGSQLISRLGGAAVSEILVPPFYITYEGKDADKHVLSARQLGESMVGASKLYSDVVHYCMFGTVPRGRYQKLAACYAKPPSEGCFEYMLFVGSLASDGILLNTIFKEGVGFLVPYVIGSIKKLWSKPTEVENVVNRLADVMQQQLSQGDNSLAMVLANGLTRANENLSIANDKQSALISQLMTTLPELAASTRGHARGVVSPVGSTCGTVTQFAHTDQAVVIDESEAEVIRGGDELEVDDMQEFKCRRMVEVNVKNGHCILEIEGFAKLVPGKIGDPAIGAPNNIYTQALNSQTSLTISAKAVKRNGVIQRLHISDAKQG
jgi:hypothetical protein